MMLIRFAKTIQRFDQRSRSMNRYAAAGIDIGTVRKKIDTPTKIDFTVATANAAGTTEYYLDNENTRQKNDNAESSLPTESSSANLVGHVFHDKLSNDAQAIVGPAGKRSSSESQLNSETFSASSDTLNTGTGAFTECLEAISNFFSR